MVSPVILASFAAILASFAVASISFASFAGHPLLSKEIAVSRASAHKHAKLETLTLDFFDIDFRLLGTGPRSFSITQFRKTQLLRDIERQRRV